MRGRDSVEASLCRTPRTAGLAGATVSDGVRAAKQERDRHRAEAAKLMMEAAQPLHIMKPRARRWPNGADQPRRGRLALERAVAAVPVANPAVAPLLTGDADEASGPV